MNNMQFAKQHVWSRFKSTQAQQIIMRHEITCSRPFLCNNHKYIFVYILYLGNIFCSNAMTGHNTLIQWFRIPKEHWQKFTFNVTRCHAAVTAG